MIAYAGIQKTDSVFEIGTGAGILTERIACVARSVLSFEIDKRIFEVAKARISKFKNVRLKLGDAFSYSHRAHFDLCLSSLPYSRSLEFAEWMAERGGTLRTTVVIVQKEFAEKLLAVPGSSNYRAVSAISQYCFAIEKLETVESSAFIPPPSVLSCIIRLTPRKHTEHTNLTPRQIALIKKIFSFRGRMVRPALKKMGVLESYPELAESFLAKRVQELAPSDFGRIVALVSM